VPKKATAFWRHAGSGSSLIPDQTKALSQMASTGDSRGDPGAPPLPSYPRNTQVWNVHVEWLMEDAARAREWGKTRSKKLTLRLTDPEHWIPTNLAGSPAFESPADRGWRPLRKNQNYLPSNGIFASLWSIHKLGLTCLI